MTVILNAHESHSTFDVSVASMHSSMIRIKFVACTLFSFGLTMGRSMMHRGVHGRRDNELPDNGSRMVPITKASSRSRRYGSRIKAPDQPQITGTFSEASAAAPDGNDGNGNGNGNANENAMASLLQLHHRLMIKRHGISSRSTIADINRVRREVHASPEWQLAIRQGVLELQRRAIRHGA